MEEMQANKKALEATMKLIAEMQIPGSVAARFATTLEVLQQVKNLMEAQLAEMAKHEKEAKPAESEEPAV